MVSRTKAVKKMLKPKVKRKAKQKVSPLKQLARQRERKPEALPDVIAKEPEDAALEEVYLDVPSDKALKQVAELASLQLEREKTVADAELALKSAQAELREVQEDLLPEAMREAGCTEFTLANGRKLKVKDDLSCSIDKQGEKREKAFAWLEQYGLDGIIKREVSVRFGKDQLELAEKVVDAILKLDGEPEVTESVHGSTLKATLKGVMEKGIIPKGAKKPKKIDVPLDLFNGHAYSKAIIK